MIRKPTVCLSFDFDAFSTWIGLFKQTTLTLLSRGEFGARVGVPRILKLLNDYDVKATFFIPGHTIDSFPRLCEKIHDSGHEIGHHGYCHEPPTEFKTIVEERRILEKGIEAIKRITGKPPFGYRSPIWDFSPNTLDLLLEKKFVYDSSMMADDYNPYKLRKGDVFSAETPYKFGVETDLIELPVAWSQCDYPHFEFNFSPYLAGLSAPTKVLEIWEMDLEFMLERCIRK